MSVSERSQHDQDDAHRGTKPDMPSPTSSHGSVPRVQDATMSVIYGRYGRRPLPVSKEDLSSAPHVLRPGVWDEYDGRPRHTTDASPRECVPRSVSELDDIETIGLGVFHQSPVGVVWAARYRDFERAELGESQHLRSLIGRVEVEMESRREVIVRIFLLERKIRP